MSINSSLGTEDAYHPLKSGELLYIVRKTRENNGSD